VRIIWLRHRAIALAVAAWVLGHTRQAIAYESNVEASSVLQIYSVRSPWGAPIVTRQRLTHTLSLEIYRPIQDPLESKVALAFHARLRLDGDYGIEDSERDPSATGTFVPGLFVSPVDLSYGYFEARGLLSNNVSTRIGRQIVFDELGFWSYDGMLLSFAPGRLFELSAYAGYEQRGGLPFLSTSRYEADGVFRGDRTGMAANQWPSYLNSTEPAPAYGAALALTALPWLRARADYRRVTQHDTVVTVPFADSQGHLQTFSGSRISSERLGAALGADIASRASLDGALVYDLYRRVNQEHRLYATFRASPRLRFTAAYLYRLPVFDADSIFNWFGARGSIVAQSSATLALTDRLGFTLSGGARWLGVGPRQWLHDALGTGPDGGMDWLGRIESNYLTATNGFGAGTIIEAGDAGDRVSSDLWYRQKFWSRRLESRLQVGAGRWQHPLMTQRGQSSLMYVAGIRWQPGGRPELGAEWEHVMLEHAAHRFRIVATLSARWP
jgi:hypothetical protein